MGACLRWTFVLALGSHAVVDSYGGSSRDTLTTVLRIIVVWGLRTHLKRRDQGPEPVINMEPTNPRITA